MHLLKYNSISLCLGTRKLVFSCFFALFLFFVGAFVYQIDTNVKQSAKRSYAHAVEAPATSKCYFSALTISFVDFAEILVQIQVVHPSAVVLQLSKYNFYRLMRFNQSTHSVFQSNFISSTAVWELLQLKGFYLYYLRKLLI